MRTIELRRLNHLSLPVWRRGSLVGIFSLTPDGWQFYADTGRIYFTLDDLRELASIDYQELATMAQGPPPRKEVRA